jgi:endo-1,3-1,4-beta-glycanase ExoK
MLVRVFACCAVPLMLMAPSVAQTSSDVVLYASKAPVRVGKWALVANSRAAGGYLLSNPNLGAPTSTTPLANPTSYFEMTFPASSGRAYHLWIRARAEGNSTNNDSVFVQFSDSVNGGGTPVNRIGTSSGLPVILQTCNTAAIQGWGWMDNGWCGLGTAIFFKNTGAHTIRVQVREDGLVIDQIVLSPATFLSAPPGASVNDNTILAANPPVTAPQIAVHGTPSSGTAPLTVGFTATAKTGVYVARYSWSFGDGTTSTQAQPTHVYQNPGNYTAKLTITDNSGVQASASTLVSVGGSNTFSDTFGGGHLDPSKWLATNGPAPGNISGVNYGSFVSSNVDLSKGMLCLKLTQQQGPNGIISVGGEIQSATTYSYGTYEWVMRASSTSSTPTGTGSVVSGQISSGFSFVNNSQTEIDFEIEGQHPNTVWMTNWQTTSRKQYSSVFLSAPDAGFHRYKFVWVPGKIDFYVDNVLVSSHTNNVPSAPAYIMMNHWGTNSKGWGGLAAVGVQRYLYISSFMYTPLF